MTRLVRDYVEVEDKVSLDSMIDMLSTLRERMPRGARDAEVRMRGDDMFGRTLSVTFLRPLTAEELALEARYAGLDAVRAAA